MLYISVAVAATSHLAGGAATLGGYDRGEQRVVRGANEGDGGRRASEMSEFSQFLSHPVLRTKPNAYLYVCQDQVSYV